MTKIFTTLALLIFTYCLAKAQDGYIKYQTDTTYRDKTVKVFKGEIVPFFKSSKPNKINVIIGVDTITDLPINANTYSTVTSSTNDYISQKDDFLQLNKNRTVSVNVKAIPSTDTVTLISESGKQLTQLIEKRDTLLNQADLGKTFRLIISNAPTIFYSTEKLNQFNDSIPNPPNPPDDDEPDWTLWRIILISVIGLGIIGIGAWWFIKKRKNDELEEVYITFNGNSLKDFAEDNGISLAKLMKYNKKVIDKKYAKYDDRDRKQVQKDIKGKHLMVGYKSKDSLQDNNLYPTNEFLKDTVVKHTNIGNINELSSQLKQMESTLLHEIQRMSLGNSIQNQVNSLRNEKSELENKIKVLETDKRNSDLKQKQLQTDKANLESSLQDVKNEINRVQSEFKELKEKVISVEFLKGYSESVFSYIKYCQQVSSDAYNYFNKISQHDPKRTFAAGHLLINFQSAVNAIPVGDWSRTIQEIKDSGGTTNRQLSSSFSQIQNDSDKQKEFQRILFSEVLIRYSSNILILAEAFKNLSRFQGSADFAIEEQSIFGKHVTEIVNKAKSTGLEIKHIPLFDSWEKYLGQVEDNGGDRSLAYKEIFGLERGAIAEIVAYGVKTSLGDDTKTIIILA